MHSVDLTWMDTLNPMGTTYSVYRAPGLCSGTPTFAKIATGVTILTYTDPSVTIGNFCYEVTATFNGLESAPSNMSQAIILPSPPTGLLNTAK